MKTERITVNKTSQQPQGVEIDLVVPESNFEERVLGFLMVGFLRDLKRENRIPYDLPAQIRVDYTGKGTFLASSVSASGAFYEPPMPVAMIGLRVAGAGFDLVHADAKRPQAAQPQQPAAPAAEQPAASETPAAPAEPAQGEQPA